MRDRASKPIDPVAIARLEGESTPSSAGDARLVELLRQRQEARKAAGTDSAHVGRCERIEAQMMEIPASGAAGMAIKIYLMAQALRGSIGDDGLGVDGFHSFEYAAPGDRLFEDDAWLRSLVDDAARLMPDLAPLMTRITAAPFQLPESKPLVVSTPQILENKMPVIPAAAADAPRPLANSDQPHEQPQSVITGPGPSVSRGPARMFRIQMDGKRFQFVFADLSKAELEAQKHAAAFGRRLEIIDATTGEVVKRIYSRSRWGFGRQKY